MRKPLHKIEVGQKFQTNKYGEVEVTGFRQSKGAGKVKVLVKFIDTGFECEVERGNLIAGKVKDHSKPHHAIKDWEDCHIELTNNAGESLTIVKKKGNKKVIVVFKETNYMTEAYYENVIKGKIKDPYAKSFLGVGYLGEFDRPPYWKTVRQLWTNMMKRCYNPKDDKGYFGRCFVDDRWHCFANFLNDLPSLKNFDEWLNWETTGVKYNLDKDLKIPGNNIYSKHACEFVTEHINKGAATRGKKRVDGVWVDAV